MFSSQCPRACHVIISFSFSSSTKLLKVPNIVEHQLNEYLWEKCFIQHSFTIYSAIYGSDILLLSLWYYEQFIMYAKIDSHMRNAVFELPRETRNDLVS